MLVGGETMQRLDMGFHKTILTITLVILLIIAVALGSHLLATGQSTDVMGIALFSMSFVLFALCTLTISIIIRTRDELHTMHEENKQQFHEILDAVKPRSKRKS